MAQNIFKSDFFSDEDKAYAMLEAIRWPDGPICPRQDCRGTKVYRIKPMKTGRRILTCAQCRKQFSVTIGTIFEDSHLPLTKWFAAIHLMNASKKGMSALQLQRMLDIKSYKSAWFMAHRIRYAMTEPNAIRKLTGIVEADETYIGGKAKSEERFVNKSSVMALVERKGRVRSFVIGAVTARNLKNAVRLNVYPEARIMTDDHPGYKGLAKSFTSHDSVNHSRKEYVRGEAHTNTVEGYFGLLKRGINGTFHHVSHHHLHRYLAEFDFRYNARKTTDDQRALLAVRGIEGKRLQYRSTH